jgi:hypothetical protein
VPELGERRVGEAAEVAVRGKVDEGAYEQNDKDDRANLHNELTSIRSFPVSGKKTSASRGEMTKFARDDSYGLPLLRKETLYTKGTASAVP